MTPSEASRLMQASLTATVNDLKRCLDDALPTLHATIERRVTAAYLSHRPEGVEELQKAMFNELANSFERMAKEIRK